MFAVSKQHTFEQFAVAIDDAFARWDRAHLHEFHLFGPGDTFETRPARVADPDPDWGDGPPVMPIRKTKLSTLKLGQQFLYVFDLGDDWTHLCTVSDKMIDRSRPPHPSPFDSRCRSSIWGEPVTARASNRSVDPWRTA